MYSKTVELHSLWLEVHSTCMALTGQYNANITTTPRCLLAAREVLQLLRVRICAR
jgi:hypothetical protein